ncbi:pimeloyl-ACP methyl ester carboxylesterase [Murinocardiopsis flavida]|uniref:Pimeloyl-ACP methyl ester carboxylesterase n=1 Tax=Murinocardiopsis flavida TaxID=645275 RepID=A0A2P8CVF3_9ACTN|nr:alpha/beta hydrolase [Murinocardiopsis flavida]PSK88937.1 pimeloyl-ACP methyl ester carboxylesterase [Murinocardiopsis flavida]
MLASDLPTTTVFLGAGPIEYRLERRDAPVVVVLHGGHMRAGLPVGEDAFAAHTVLAVSRPGYGRTPITTGTTPEGFADAVRELGGRLGIDHVAAVAGTSGGGPTALALAARHPGFVRRIVLESAVGLLPWPDPRTRAAGRIVFDPDVERMTWAATRLLMRLAPGIGLRAMLGSLSTEPAGEVLARLDGGQRAALAALFGGMRSGRGFRNDLRRGTHVLRPVPAQPTLVVATRKDGAVPFAQAESLVAALPDAELVESRADTHLVWFGADYPEIAARIGAFLAAAQDG